MEKVLERALGLLPYICCHLLQETALALVRSTASCKQCRNAGTSNFQCFLSPYFSKAVWCIALGIFLAHFFSAFGAALLSSQAPQGLLSNLTFSLLPMLCFLTRPFANTALRSCNFPCVRKRQPCVLWLLPLPGQ